MFTHRQELTRFDDILCYWWGHTDFVVCRKHVTCTQLLKPTNRCTFGHIFCRNRSSPVRHAQWCRDQLDQSDTDRQELACGDIVLQALRPHTLQSSPSWCASCPCPAVASRNWITKFQETIVRNTLVEFKHLGQLCFASTHDILHHPISVHNKMIKLRLARIHSDKEQGIRNYNKPVLPWSPERIILAPSLVVTDGTRHLFIM